MARLPAAFALAAVLLLAAGIGPGNGQLVLIPEDQSTGCLALPGGQFPSSLLDLLAYKFLSALPPMRIISKGNPSLSIAADGKGGVVLAQTNCRDTKQLWVQDFSAGGGQSYSLVNLANINDWNHPQLLAMEIPNIDSDERPVKLNPYNPPFVPASMLWTQDTVLPFNDGFYKIHSLQNQGFVLDGLKGNVHEGTVVGAYPEIHNDDNVLWKIEGFLSNP